MLQHTEQELIEIMSDNTEHYNQTSLGGGEQLYSSIQFGIRNK